MAPLARQPTSTPISKLYFKIWLLCLVNHEVIYQFHPIMEGKCAIQSFLITKPFTTFSKLTHSQRATRDRLSVVAAVAVSGQFPSLFLCPLCRVLCVHDCIFATNLSLITMPISISAHCGRKAACHKPSLFSTASTDITNDDDTSEIE